MSKTWVILCTLLLSLSAPMGAQRPTTFDPFEATIPQMREALSSGAITCRQLVQFYLDRIAALDTAGPKLNSFRTLNSKALEMADAKDRTATFARDPLGCIPIVVKDNIDTADMPTTAGSVSLQNTFPLEDSFLVK